MTQNSEPKKHHYIPVFYLRRWTRQDGTLVEFSRPHKNKIKPLSKAPQGTGYVNRLYEIQGVPAEQAQHLEQLFMSPVDSAAADSLKILERDENEQKWDSHTRSAWARFILSLLLRTPDDMRHLRQQIRLELFRTTATEEQKYIENRGLDDPPTFTEFIKQREAKATEKLFAQLTRSLIDHEGIGTRINNFLWFTRDTQNSDIELLTSDRPVLMSTLLSEPNAYIILPIGPRWLFVAVPDNYTASLLKQRPATQLVKEVNKQVVTHAVKYVYGANERQLPFIEKHFGKSQRSSLLERLARHREQARTDTAIATENT